MEIYSFIVKQHRNQVRSGSKVTSLTDPIQLCMPVFSIATVFILIFKLWTFPYPKLEKSVLKHPLEKVQVGFSESRLSRSSTCVYPDCTAMPTCTFSHGQANRMFMVSRVDDLLAIWLEFSRRWYTVKIERTRRADCCGYTLVNFGFIATRSLICGHRHGIRFVRNCLTVTHYGIIYFENPFTADTWLYRSSQCTRV